MEISSNKSNVREFSEDEEALVDRMFNLLGRRWPLIAGRIPGRTSEEIEHYCTTRFGLVNKQGKGTDPFHINNFAPKSPEVKRKLLPQVEELLADSMSSNEEDGGEVGSMSATHTAQIKPVLDKVGAPLAGQYTKPIKVKALTFWKQNKTGPKQLATRPQVLDMQKQIVQQVVAEKRKAVDRYFESSSRKVAKTVEAELVKAQVVVNAAHKEDLENMQIKINDAIAKDKPALANIRLEKDKANDDISAWLATLENQSNYLSELSKFVQAHAAECAHFAVKLKEWSIAPCE